MAVGLTDISPLAWSEGRQLLGTVLRLSYELGELCHDGSNIFFINICDVRAR